MQWLRSQFRTFRKIRDWWQRRLTLTGQAMAVVVAICSPAMIIPDTALTILFVASFFLLLLTWVLGRLHRPKLQWSVMDWPRWRCTQGEVLQFEVKNLGRAPALALRFSCLATSPTWSVKLLDKQIDRLAPQTSSIVRVLLTPSQRGLHCLPGLTVESHFPFGIHRIPAKAPPRNEVLIFPAPSQAIERSILESGGVRRIGQTTAGDHPGWSGDYIGSREYFPGMAVRRWDYGSWARLGKPVVREFSNPQFPKARILLDLSGQRSRNAMEIDSQVESVISVANQLCKTLLNLGVQITAIDELGNECWTRNPRNIWKGGEIDRYFALLTPRPNAPRLKLDPQLSQSSSTTWTLLLSCSLEVLKTFENHGGLFTHAPFSLCLIQPGKWPADQSFLSQYVPPKINKVRDMRKVLR